jgi:hypothetical protein
MVGTAFPAFITKFLILEVPNKNMNRKTQKPHHSVV